MSAHTPGPWQFIDILGACIVRAGQREVLAYRHSPDAENKANARLIAAAPELLAALELIAEQSSEGAGSTGPAGWFGAIARAAIAKATGGA